MYDPQESDPFENQDLRDQARKELKEEFREMQSYRVMSAISVIREDLQDFFYQYYQSGHMSRLQVALDFAEADFISRHIDDQIMVIIEESKQDTREAYANYLLDN